jgi:hypothetical protein
MSKKSSGVLKHRMNPRIAAIHFASSSFYYRLRCLHTEGVSRYSEVNRPKSQHNHRGKNKMFLKKYEFISNIPAHQLIAASFTNVSRGSVACSLFHRVRLPTAASTDELFFVISRYQRTNC